MEGFEPKKLALIRIWQILREYSDEKHPLTQEAIAARLKKDHGIVIERKAIARNISLLKEAGIEVAARKNGSYLEHREFEDSELRLLIDGVLSSKHITAQYSKDLIERLCKLSNRYFQSSVKHVYSVNEWNKTDNRSLFLNIDLINEAIEANHKIHYDYNKYGIDKKMHKSSHHHVSPYQMLIHNQRYYLMAYSDCWEHIVFHRLDRMTNMKVDENKTAVPIRSVKGYENGINYKELSTALPYMYTDTPERIEFLADTAIVDQVIDWFGTDIRLTETDAEDTVCVSIKASPKAMEHWAMQYSEHVEILSPASLRDKIRDILHRSLEKYS